MGENNKRASWSEMEQRSRENMEGFRGGARSMRHCLQRSLVGSRQNERKNRRKGKVISKK